ncbi:hypothetical protein PR202_ga06893 [Eleusine coracana subsp. coracana]|uniref:Uncharacterized protein n=1 Tax=Eleusine coracana subsp. coracana TaxID=191504 RepID=A0AAV5BZF9_ELECO|nr:hypothetical protein PR202_ga06893 [Eleusine coracana subsp. coracana]
MDHPWRFSAGGDLCPGCSARHFPFCPPPPLPPHPFPYDLQPPPPPAPPQYQPPFHPPPPPPSPPPYQPPFHPPPSMWGSAAPGPHPYEIPGREGPHKRMRVGEVSPFNPYDASPPPPPPQPGRASERLLGLVREHGHSRLPASPPTQWHGQACPPDGFSYGGGRVYHSPYGQGADLANFGHAGRLPPPLPMHDRHNALGPGFLPGRGPQESYFNGDHHYHQFHQDALPGAPPLPPMPRCADTSKPYDRRAWHPEAGATPPPPEPPFPSHPDYRAMPPRPTANLSLFPVLSGSPATTTTPLPSSVQTLHQAHPMANANSYDGHTNIEGSGLIYRPQSELNLVDGGATSAHHSLNPPKVTIINACDLFKQPLRASRPDHIVIILRGLPGSGKSYLAKALRDLEVENGASAPRIHSMDDYFMIEVEKRSGYEVYLLEAPYKDPTSLFHDDNLHGHSIQEVDMDTEDVDDANDTATNTTVEDSKKAIQEPPPEGLSKPGEKWNDEEENLDGFKELGQSKWSKYFEEDTEKSENAEENKHALSGLARTYGTHRKSVSWGDRLEKGGFSIAATKRKLTSSLIIGPGSGYNLVSNPLAEDFTGTKGRTSSETKKRFSEQLRNEGESFRAVFDKRKQCMGVFENGDKA